MGIGALNETPLHAALKAAVAPPGSRFEVNVDGFVVDAVCGDLLIEVQTRHLGAMRRKLERLLVDHPLRLVLPVATERWILKRGDPPQRRRSPKRGHPADVARELVAIPHLLDHPNLELELVLVHEEEVREHRPGMAWRRRGWVTVDRRLLAVVERRPLRGAASLLELVPPGLADPFDTGELALLGGMARSTAQKLAYCLRLSGRIEVVGAAGNARLYART
jgi:hypothetical protein